MRPAATIGSMVFFPACTCGPKIYPIATGHPNNLEVGIPIATATSLVAAPTFPPPIVVPGSPLQTDIFMTESHIGDLAVCVRCGVGVIVTGIPSRMGT